VKNFGCQSSDYAGFVSGSIALVLRGTCDFFTKATTAVNAGAAGLLIYNDVKGLMVGTLGKPMPIPVLALTQELGLNLKNEFPPPSVKMIVNSLNFIAYTSNVIATNPVGNFQNRRIIVGSHLDSVEEGPGINDNGSGSAVNLQLAVGMFNNETFVGKVQNQVQFAWWGAEELGKLGSIYYVDSLTPAQKKNISLNLNFDMLGSPNFYRAIYDGAGANSTIKRACITIMTAFIDFFNKQKLPWDLTPFDGRSDYFGFINNDIPAGGLASGAEKLKSMEQRTTYGGLANCPYDPCYHNKCDTYENIDFPGLMSMANASAYVVGLFASQPNLPVYLNGNSATEHSPRRNTIIGSYLPREIHTKIDAHNDRVIHTFGGGFDRIPENEKSIEKFGHFR